MSIKPLIITEGKTDWKHLKKALERFQLDGDYINLNIEFEEYQDIGVGESTIDSWLKSTAKLKQERIHIFIFDRDTSKYVQEYGGKDFTRVMDKDYLNRLKEKLEKYYGDKSSMKYLNIEQYLDNGLYQKADKEIQKAVIGNEYDEWKKLSNNQVYALCIPEIKNSDSPRTLDKICIEFYYKEKDLKTTKDGKRLFFADEFEFNKENNGDDLKRFISRCGQFKTSSCQVKKGATAELTLVSTPVYSIDDEQCKNNLLLSKNDFTKYIENEVQGFDNFDIKNFKLIFDVIEKIVNKKSSNLSKKYRKKQLNENLYHSVPKLPSEYLPREEDMSKVKRFLLENNNQNIGLYGMGGIGKSIFSIALGLDDELKRHFKDGIYFIQLGQDPDIENIQINLLSYFNIEDLNSITVKSEIKNLFLSKKALLIIDDIWDIKDVESFKIKGKESKILITTRQKDIITAMDAKEYLVNLLSKEQSISLLEKKLGKKIEKELFPFAEDILKRCRYLPLAINIIGNILKEKEKDKEYWENVLGKLEKSKLEKLKSTTTNEQHTNLFKVIELSVNYLDREYKDKYLSLNVFENIKSIPSVTLKIYWGEDYLDIIDELINASLLFKDNVRGKILYHVHDLQADYIKRMADGKSNYKKRLRKKYKSDYFDKWSEIPIEDSYF